MSTSHKVYDFHRSIGHDIEFHHNALLVPWGINEPSGAKRAAGIFDAAGNYLTSAECLRTEADPITIRPEFDADARVQDLNGRYLFGGLLYGHFGHFLCESTGRLWALDAIEGEIDGIVWFPKLPMGHAAKLTRPYKPFFNALGHPELELVAPQVVTRIRELIIPAQGFGIGELSAGSPEFRQFMRRNLGGAVGPDGADKLYVSRSGLPVKRGSLLMEQRIEELLRLNGFEIFHPQDHPIEVQIARYKAAHLLVGLDGSALHLAAMAVPAECRVAIINRGPSQNIDDYLRQFQHFAGISATRIDAVTDYWFTAGRRVVKRETQALADFPTLGAALVSGGFISSATDWLNPEPGVVAAEVTARELRCGVSLQHYRVA